MKKFLVLLQKELRELLTVQLIVPLVMIVILFMFLGNFLSKQQAKAQNAQGVVVLNQDNTPLSQALISTLEANKLTVTVSTETTEQTAEKSAPADTAAFLVIPAGYQAALASGAQANLELYVPIRSFSPLSLKGYTSIRTSLAAANEAISNSLIQSSTKGNLLALKNPLHLTEYAEVAGRQTQADVSQVINYVTSQTTYIPIILFIVLTFASQLIATSIASEKENKTLETLLSLPIKRSTIVMAKMLAAALVAAAMSLFYLFGLRHFMGTSTGSGATSTLPNEVATYLHLTLNSSQYVILGLTLFMGILAALAIAMILGSFAQDIRSVQGLLTPLMALTIVPYILSLVTDINSLSAGEKLAVYAIPFTNSFTAAPNLLLGNTPVIWYGLLYQLAWFVVFVWIITKLFASDRIITMRLNFSRRK